VSYNAAMESIVRNVKDIESDERRVYEHVLGERLREHQRVFIMLLDPGVLPDQQSRRTAVADIKKLAAKAAENIERQGASPDHVDAIVDEAIDNLRRRGRS
jgi:hypothetical protein